MDVERKRSLAFKIFIILTVIGLIIAITEIYGYFNEKDSALKNVKEGAALETSLAAGQIDAQVRKIKMIAESLASRASDEVSKSEEAIDLIQATLEKSPPDIEITLAFQPNILEDETGLFAPQCSVVRGETKLFRADKTYDYTKAEWYINTIEKGAGWIEPHFDPVSKRVATGYSAPIARNEEKVGVVRVSLTEEGAKNIVNKLRLGRAGYGFVASEKGTLVTYPLQDYVENLKTLSDLAKESKSVNFIELTKKALTGQNGFYEIAAHPGGEKTWIFLQHVKSTGWSLFAIYEVDDLDLNHTELRKAKIRIFISLIIFLTMLSIVVFKAHKLEKRNLWIVSFTFSILCIVGTCVIWYLALAAPLNEEMEHTPVTDIGVLNRFTASYKDHVQSLHGAPPVFIPTGISIQTLEFSGSNDLAISGFLWQKYKDGIHDNIERGFFFPEEKSISINEIYRQKKGDEEVIGWYFETKIREYFNYSKYPFDRPNAWLWIKHRDFDRNVVLVPDLSSYKLITPKAYPGLQEDIVLPGFTPLGTFFDYRLKTSNANLGIDELSRGNIFPEFYYNVILSRDFLSPFVSKIFPVLIIIIMLFIVLMKFSTDEEQKKSYGLSGMGVMAVIVSFLFPTFLSHANLRQELAVSGITYIEYFHFITYLILLAMAIVAYLFARKKETPLVHYEDCLIPKLLYWPIFTGLVLLISLKNFY